MKATIVIGKNFGDEGKGLAADYFALQAVRTGASAICVRHNGGAQAGHTVDFPEKRFVFSQLSSASFRGVNTYWADSFLPDLYKLSEEITRFRSLQGTVPQVFASPDCRCTCISDILLNMLLETSRGEKRHGSCGMGINEAVVRSARFPLHLRDILGADAESLYHWLRIIQRDYLPLRLAELKIDLRNVGEYGELLQSDSVLRNAAEQMARNTAFIQLSEQNLLRNYDHLLFEGAQGLLLDELYTEYAPHLTTSRTGLYEPARILRGVFGENMPEAEIVYVTRSYVTRHGAGPLPYEELTALAAYGHTDRTNLPNVWQGILRTAAHGDATQFTKAVKADLAEGKLPCNVSLFVTHLNETEDCIITKNGNIPVRDYCSRLYGLFGRLYLSDSPFTADIRTETL